MLVALKYQQRNYHPLDIVYMQRSTGFFFQIKMSISFLLDNHLLQNGRLFRMIVNT